VTGAGGGVEVGKQSQQRQGDLQRTHPIDPVAGASLLGV
jgi:hypothetical protein